MSNKYLFLILFLAVVMLLMASMVSVSAQEIDISSLSEEQRTILLISLLQQMQQDNPDLIPMLMPTATPVPTNTPTPVPNDMRLEELNSDQFNALLLSLLTQMQLPQTPLPLTTDTETFRSYENKKLMIEQLPGYMFIQKESTPEPEEPGKDSNSENYYDMLRETYGPDFKPEEWDSNGWDWSIDGDGQIIGVKG